MHERWNCHSSTRSQVPALWRQHCRKVWNTSLGTSRAKRARHTLCGIFFQFRIYLDHGIRNISPNFKGTDERWNTRGLFLQCPVIPASPSYPKRASLQEWLLFILTFTVMCLSHSALTPPIFVDRIKWFSYFHPTSQCWLVLYFSLFMIIRFSFTFC